MSPKYPINQAFASIPNLKITRNVYRLSLLSCLIRATRVFHRWGNEVEVRRHKIKSRDGYALTLIEVSPANLKAKRPALVYYHGGGFFLAYGALHLNRIKDYALSANCAVFLVEYRRSLKFAFPTPFDDCFTALEWVCDNAGTLKIDGSRIVVGGDSAGGCLAAVVAQKALDSTEAGHSNIQLAGQLLIYPVIDCETKTESAVKFNDTPVWSTEANKIMWELYLKDSFSDAPNEQKFSDIPQYASPIHRDNFANLPRAYIEAAEFDPLRDEANNYAQRLSADGVAVQVEQVAGAVHAYDFAECEISREYKTRRVAALKRFFS